MSLTTDDDRGDMLLIHLKVEERISGAPSVYLSTDLTTDELLEHREGLEALKDALQGFLSLEV